MKEKERQRWHRRKAAGKVKVFSELNAREQRVKRRNGKKA
jgi:predicted Fe-S protein YdhL (DUF1289 family)